MNRPVSKRRRPGQRASASKALGRSVYDVNADKTVRAKATFRRISLGQACDMSCTQSYEITSHGRSFIAKDEHPTLTSGDLSDTEIELIFKLRDSDSYCPDLIREKNPGLHSKIRQIARNMVKEKLLTARRARHTPNFLMYVKYLERLPRYNRLALNEDTAAFIPY